MRYKLYEAIVASFLSYFNLAFRPSLSSASLSHRLSHRIVFGLFHVLCWIFFSFVSVRSYADTSSTCQWHGIGSGLFLVLCTHMMEMKQRRKKTTKNNKNMRRAPKHVFGHVYIRIFINEFCVCIRVQCFSLVHALFVWNKSILLSKIISFRSVAFR